MRQRTIRIDHAESTTFATDASTITAYWNERAESYSNGVRGELGDERREAWQRELERISIGHIMNARFEDRQARVLDLGCGPGFFSVLFADMDCRVDGIDASPEMIARARANVQAAGHAENVTLHEGDVTMLPFADNTFDIVASRNLTWLMRDPVGAYEEWLRVLRPGGKLVVFDANWYRYLVDPVVDTQRRIDQAKCVVEEWDEQSRATTAEERRCEELAANLPLTPVMRPAWDLETLTELGAERIYADETVWTELWDTK